MPERGWIRNQALIRIAPISAAGELLPANGMPPQTEDPITRRWSGFGDVWDDRSPPLPGIFKLGVLFAGFLTAPGLKMTNELLFRPKFRGAYHREPLWIDWCSGGGRKRHR